MAKGLQDAHQKTYISKDVITGTIIGGFVGILFGYLLTSNILIIPRVSLIFSSISVNKILGGALLGIVIGELIGGLSTLSFTENIFGEYLPEPSTPKQSTYECKNVRLQIKEEQLDLAKQMIQTGEVKIYREYLTEEKSFTIPVIREELVIEKKKLAAATPEHEDGPTDIIRIVLSEEQVEFTKHKVALEDVSIYKQQVQDIIQIEETLKREKLNINTSESPMIKD